MVTDLERVCVLSEATLKRWQVEALERMASDADVTSSLLVIEGGVNRRGQPTSHSTLIQTGPGHSGFVTEEQGRKARRIGPLLGTCLRTSLRVGRVGRRKVQSHKKSHDTNRSRWRN